jgi:hypothetical protein
VTNDKQKLDLAELFSQFASAKGHFVNSQREMLLAFREVCHVMVDLAESSQVSLGGEFPVYVLKATAAVIDYFIARVPEQGKPADVLAAKINAIDELITILDEEAVRIGTEAKDEIDLAKVEAIRAVKNYLESERKVAEEEKEKPENSARIRKVDID